MRSILAVDDNQDDLFLLERTLSRSGIEHRLLTAGDGVDAEALLDSLERDDGAAFPFLIFLDIHMPRLDGLQFLHRCKHRPHRAAIPVVMLSSFEDRREMDKAFALGATACLHKPPSLEEVGRLVNTLAKNDSTGPGHAQPVLDGQYWS